MGRRKCPRCTAHGIRRCDDRGQLKKLRKAGQATHLVPKFVLPGFGWGEAMGFLRVPRTQIPLDVAADRRIQSMLEYLRTLRKHAAVRFGVVLIEPNLDLRVIHFIAFFVYLEVFPERQGVCVFLVPTFV